MEHSRKVSMMLLLALCALMSLGFTRVVEEPPQPSGPPVVAVESHPEPVYGIECGEPTKPPVKRPSGQPKGR